MKPPMGAKRGGKVSKRADGGSVGEAEDRENNKPSFSDAQDMEKGSYPNAVAAKKAA